MASLGESTRPLGPGLLTSLYHCELVPGLKNCHLSDQIKQKWNKERLNSGGETMPLKRNRIRKADRWISDLERWDPHWVKMVGMPLPLGKTKNKPNYLVSLQLLPFFLYLKCLLGLASEFHRTPRFTWMTFSLVANQGLSPLIEINSLKGICTVKKHTSKLDITKRDSGP